MAETADSAQGGVPSLPEDVQLMLLIGKGQVAWGFAELSAAALVELTLLGRIGSVPETGPFSREEARKLVVLDAEPTGVQILDCALERLVARGKPWEALSCVKKLAGPVGRLVHQTLLDRGTLRGEGRWLKATLWVADEEQYRATVYRLNSAWLKPDAVTDPRSGAFIDVLRNAGDQYSREAGKHGAVIAWEWYPRGMRDTIYAILDAERIANSLSSGAGYEG